MKHMISAKELNRLGLPDDPRLMPLALKLANTFQACGADGGRSDETAHENICDAIRTLASAPETMLNHEHLGSLAGLFMELFPDGSDFTPRETPAPWRQWGNKDVEEEAVRQMENACRIPARSCPTRTPATACPSAECWR